MVENFPIATKKLAHSNNWFAKRIEDKKSVNIYFAFNFADPNYYFLAQLFYLSKIAQAKNVFLYLCLGDTVILPRKRSYSSEQFSDYDKIRTDALLREVTTIMESFGIERERLFVYKASENWHRLLKLDEETIFLFFRGLNAIPSKAQNVGRKISELFYLPENTRYELGYVVNKYLDLFVSSNFHKLFPEEIKGKIDAMLVGNYGEAIVSNIRNILSKEGLISEDNPFIASFPELPCFGQSPTIDNIFNVPNWNQEPEEILNTIEKYSVPANHIKTILENLVTQERTEIVCPVNGKQQSFDLKKIKLNLPLKTQRVILAHALFDFLQDMKQKVKPSGNNPYLNIEKKEEIKEICKTFKSNLVLDILSLSNGNYTVSEIANKLNKHISNVSAAISSLKRKKLLQINNNGKVEKAVKTIKINLG